MPGNDPLQSRDDHTTPSEQFRKDRLERDEIDPTTYPAQVDRAAADILRGIAVGATDDPTDIGGTIDKFNFDSATGQFYTEGLIEIAGEDSPLAANLREYDYETIGDLAFQLNSLRHTLRETGSSMDIDRALEALLEKTAAAAIERSVKSGGNDGAGLRALRDTDSVSDLTARLFSDPRVDAYAQALVDQIPASDTESAELVEQLDEARMTTPLWNHQREALERWHTNQQRGYVDMATATGKTVLGLAAIALRYGSLHPTDTSEAPELRDTSDIPAAGTRPRVLIVAGTELLLGQWRAELDEHLDIPRDRTEPVSDDDRMIELSWGDIEFRTAQGLLETAEFTRYDLVILDEAHRYSSGKTDGRGWGDLFEDLTAGADAILAMSGSVDSGWTGDETAENALEQHLDQCYKFDVAKARREGVIADFTWQVRYLPVTGDRVDRLGSQTRITSASYDSETGTIDADRLNVDATKLPTDIVDYNDLRSFVQSNDGGDLRSSSTQFDAFASALLARKPLRWNTAPDSEAIAALVAEHAPAQKTVVLVRSYDAAAELRSILTERHGISDDAIVAFTDSSEDRLEKIERFNELSQGVIIGPGDLLGTGVDMPDAEVAVNVSRGGVNASLVQRIGRVLRNPTGDKEATFYHLVAQPLETDAIDAVEDGAQLLERAAEFRALGDTFREVPSYKAHDDVASTLVTLENEGVKLFERIDDETQLVTADEAHEHVRTLQAMVYDAAANTDDPTARDRPVLESWGDASTGTDQTSEETFPQRNAAYERYRLSLGPYRVAKAVATQYYDMAIDIEERDGRYHVEFEDDELAGTEYHEDFERWLNSYRQWRERCDNRDGSGEPGSLPQYKGEWPEPPGDKGVMLPREVVDEIGISYADADPIFFPYVDGELYALPLPDGQYLTVDGITDSPDGPSEEQTGEEDAGYTIDAVLLAAAQERDESLDETLSQAVTSFLKEAIEKDSIDSEASESNSRAEVDVELLDRHERLLQALAEEEPAIDGVNDLLDIALRQELKTTVDSVTISLDGVLSAAVRSQIDADTSVEDHIRKTLTEALERDLS